MSKIRINELARQLEVPSHEILEMLPELGVTEKKTHSSSIDDHVADKSGDIIWQRNGHRGTRRRSRGGTVHADNPRLENA